MLKGRAPPCVYSLWIREKWMLFQLELIVFGHKVYEDKVKFFMNVFRNHKTPIFGQNLLCEFYLYNYIFPKNTKVNLNLLVGDIYLRALCWDFTHELEMYEKRIAFKKMEINELLIVRAEHLFIIKIIVGMNSLEKQRTSIDQYARLQKHDIQLFRNTCNTKLKKVLSASTDRWKEFLAILRKRKPHSIQNLRATIKRVR